MLWGSVCVTAFADPGDDHWAFRKLTRPAVPVTRQQPRTPVDAILLAKLEAKGLGFAGAADARGLVRRVYLDLIGLPPAAGEVEAFVRDSVAKPQAAYEALIDRLLCSPHFGERWGRHWLDEAGYTDVTGGDNDAATVKLSPNRWLYRDYVVRAHNEDKPFRRFLTEQLAGDELVDWRVAPVFTPEVRELLVATGFLRLAADDTDENELNTPDIRHGVLQRTAETVAGNVLALTLNCAKCHDHKYEPITQEDYYRFQALLQPTLDPNQWRTPKDRQLAAAGTKEKAAIDEWNAGVQGQVAVLTKRKAGERDKEAAAKLDREIARLNGTLKKSEMLQAAFEPAPPTPTRLLRRGNHDRPGVEVAPGFLAVLSPPGQPDHLATARAAGKSSGRRLALAQWLTDADTPAGALVLRVRVNRIWQRLFGRGLVETSDNLGTTGARPTHPELLEWLAAEFDAGGQRLKPFLRVLMTSAAYRQASSGPSNSVDPDNRLLGRMPLRRVEAEVVRDALLAASGELDRRLGGPPVPVEARPDGTFVVSEKAPPADQRRRSLYLLGRRNYHPTVLGVFDLPNLTTNCTARASSAVVLQTLTMLNDRFVRGQAEAIAGGVEKSAGPNDDARVRLAFALVLCRPPSDGELADGVTFLDQQAGRYRAAGTAPEQARTEALRRLCHMLVNTSEFLYTP